jgi:hypothetical protein
MPLRVTGRISLHARASVFKLREEERRGIVRDGKKSFGSSLFSLPTDADGDFLKDPLQMQGFKNEVYSEGKKKMRLKNRQFLFVDFRRGIARAFCSGSCSAAVRPLLLWAPSSPAANAAVVQIKL